jgi:hypothetical protein
MNLHELFATLTVEQREALAKKVPTEAGYLWQLSKQWRGKKPSLGLMKKLVAADSRLTLAELVEEFAGARSEEPEAHAKAAKKAVKRRNQDRSNGHKER